ncbi:MAG: hypothetical protein Q8Q09_13145, partial [Deltaproteobacteria bacterium]|nr:hypothetical protein [Deltaproteobacteria bacterium]
HTDLTGPVAVCAVCIRACERRQSPVSRVTRARAHCTAHVAAAQWALSRNPALSHTDLTGPVANYTAHVTASHCALHAALLFRTRISLGPLPYAPCAYARASVARAQ